MTDNTYKKYYYILITVYPLKGNPYPRQDVIDIHPIDYYINYTEKAMALPSDKRPYRVALQFFSEIPKEQHDTYVEAMSGD
jgi:hypothetical protein